MFNMHPIKRLQIRLNDNLSFQEICGCKPPFYVLGALGNIETCQGTQLNCAYKIFDDPINQVKNESLKKCLAPCNDQVYDSRITLAKYPNRSGIAFIFFFFFKVFTFVEFLS